MEALHCLLITCLQAYLSGILVPPDMAQCLTRRFTVYQSLVILPSLPSLCLSISHTLYLILLCCLFRAVGCRDAGYSYGGD